MSDLSPEDRCQLCKLQMDVDKKGLQIQKAQQDLDRFVLEVEHKSGLMGEDNTIDPQSGTVKRPTLPPRNRDAPATQARPGMFTTGEKFGKWQTWLPRRGANRRYSAASLPR